MKNGIFESQELSVLLIVLKLLLITRIIPDKNDLLYGRSYSLYILNIA